MRCSIFLNRHRIASFCYFLARKAREMTQNPFLRAIFMVVKWFPVVFITAVAVWSYYAYVVELCVREVQSDTEKAFYLIFYHIFFILFAWSYWQCIFTNGGNIPAKFFLTTAQASDLETKYLAKDFEGVKSLLENFARDLPVLTRGYNGDIRYCEKCQLIKPDRAHHCSVCERCITKMDHHCPWVNTCVCFDNYKFFLLFLGYAILYCLYISLTDLQYFIRFWKKELQGGGNNLHILFLFFVSSMFMISLVTLLGYHIFLTVTNRTTIESYRTPIFSGGTDKNGFNVGKRGNFIQVFGERKLFWFLPIFTSLGDGSEYPTRSARSSAYQPHSVETGPTQYQDQYHSELVTSYRDTNSPHGRPSSSPVLSSSGRLTRSSLVDVGRNGNSTSEIHRQNKNPANGSVFVSVPLDNSRASPVRGEPNVTGDGVSLLDLRGEKSSSADWTWPPAAPSGTGAMEGSLDHRLSTDGDKNLSAAYSSSSAIMPSGHLQEHSHSSQLILLNEQY